MSTDAGLEHSVSSLARRAVLAIEPYAWESSTVEIAAQFGIDPAQVIRFDTNTAPLPPPCLPTVLRRIEADPQVNEYFDASYTDLAQALCEYTGFQPENLVIGAGADEILDVVAKAFLDPDDVAVVPAPSYAMYRIVSQTMGGVVRPVPANPDLSIDVDAVADAAHGAKMVFLCNPNNPTGMRLPMREVARLAQVVEGILVIDEAYVEFSGESALSLLRDNPRLIVVRTLSKAFSLAGARIGYAVCSPEIVGIANRVRPPNSIGYMSAVLAGAAVRDLESMHANVAALVSEREWLSAALARLDLPVRPSFTNFVLARLPSPEIAAHVHGACLRQGLVLRSYKGSPLLGSYLRITARLREHNERLIDTIGACL